MDELKKPIVIACKALERSFRAILPSDIDVISFDISLHTRPKNLRATLQQAIDEIDGTYDPIYLGYGLCSQSVVGLHAKKSRVVLFTTDDCIGIFMGDHKKQQQYAYKNPGSYFMCRGWIGEGNGSVFDEHKVMIDRYGEKRGNKLMSKMLGHYNRLVHITMNDDDNYPDDKDYIIEKSEIYNLDYLEIEGTNDLIGKMVKDTDYDSNIAIFEPDEVITLESILERRTINELEQA